MAISVRGLKRAALVSMDLHSSMISIYTPHDPEFAGAVGGVLNVWVRRH
jgi:hypothetical protein